MNRVLGWVMFVIALVVYTLTLEPSVSLWDCGEFASAAYKLQVVHPPGAPLFLMVGRLFSMLAGSPAEVGFWINMLSAVSSAGCVMFTFWITTHFAQKMMAEGSENRNLLILGAGVVAALSNTFLDSFWFSAVEAEVYAMSSFFTALTFWAILRWDKHSEDPGSDRWLVFIGFLTGLALGTHMLNLLVIPAVCLAYYFKRYEINRKGIILAFIAAVFVLGLIMKVIYPGIPWLMANMDRLFVNSFGLPFYSGAIFAIIAVFAGLGYLAYYTHKNGKRNWNVYTMALLFAVLGYSSYGMVVIRSMANPAIDMNNPEDPYKFYGYITREQYGDRPLVKGPYFNAPRPSEWAYYNGEQPSKPDSRETGEKFFKGETKYESGGKGYEPEFADEYMTIFPRMGKSNKAADAKGYREYGGMGDVQQQIEGIRERARQEGRGLNNNERQQIQELELQKPTFANNLTYFLNYQIGHMYMRYFAWNFVGRFNDQQATTGNSKFDGNWYSGIGFIDGMNVGPQKNLPDYYKNQKARNAYFFLPLLLGLFGLFYHYRKSKLDFWLVMILFLFTGLLINVYMNQPPYEPRERDYSLVGSFQTFCIWLGLGVLAIADMLQKYLKKNAAIVAVAASTLLVPMNMAYQGWDDHDRSGRYIGIDLAKDFLNSLEPNAILFCNGDNDTYPLWYAQNVEGIRTDVRIINESLLPTEWYSTVLLDKVYNSDPLPLTVTKKDLQTGSFEYGIEVERKMYPKPRSMRETIQELLKNNGHGVSQDVWHGGTCFIKVDKEAVKKRGLVSKKDYGLIADSIMINVGGDYITKGDLVVWDLITTNAEQGWKRPIYFTSVSGFDFNNLNPYLQLEGLVYKFVPVRGGTGDQNSPAKIADFQLYNNLVNKFSYYGMNKKKNFFLDDKASYVPRDMQRFALDLASYYQGEIAMYEGIKGMTDSGKAVNPPPGYADVTSYLTFMKDSIPVYKQRAVTALNKILTEMPESVYPMDKMFKTEYAVLLLEFGDEKNAKKMMDLAIEDNAQFARYFSKWAEEYDWAMREVYFSKQYINRIKDVCKKKGKTEWLNYYNQKTAGI